MTEDFLRPAKGDTYLKLRVSPGARSTAIKGLHGEQALRLTVTAPPVDGRANKEAERYVAALIGARRSQSTVIKEASSRDKRVLVHGAKPEAVREGLVSFVS